MPLVDTFNSSFALNRVTFSADTTTIGSPKVFSRAPAAVSDSTSMNLPVIFQTLVTARAKRGADADLTATAFLDSDEYGTFNDCEAKAKISVKSAVTLPACSISANPTSVAYNGSSYITWSSANATSCNITSGNWVGLNGVNVSTGNLTATTTYTCSCIGPGGNSVPVNYFLLTPSRYN
jgi:hypothetical protein